MRWLKIAAVNVAVLLGLMLVIEGGSSFILFVRDITALAWEAAPYSEYDADLGWIAKPNVSLPDFWSKGVGVQTNGQRFRATHDIHPAVPAGRIRVICSGDSFTFGDGVRNADTWCEQLMARDPRIEAVNLGQGGYGTDQAYLRFLRDTRDLAFQIHVLAFIDDDFIRMQSDTFLGFDKPVLVARNGGIAVLNVPVPRRATSHAGLSAVPRALLDTRTGHLMQRLTRKVAPAEPPGRKDAETKAVLRAMFADLKRANEQKGSRLILLHLTQTDTPPAVDPWYPFLAETAQALGIPLVDGVAAFRARTDIRELFLTETTAAGHFNAAGHALIADLVNAEIQKTSAR